MDKLDEEITRIFRDMPVVSITEGKTSHVSLPHDKGARPSIEIAKPEPASGTEALDPAEARRRLQILLTRIGRAVQMGGGKAQDQCRSELEQIKRLITDKDYIAAYKLALDCMERLDVRSP
jgi:hypothetical protein